MNAIKSYRERSGMKQLEVAGRIGISVATLRRYETAAQMPRWDEIDKMCKLFGCSAEELMNRNPIQSPAPAGGLETTA